MNLRKPVLFLVLAASLACSRSKHYELKGQVLAVNRDKQELLVKHDEIVGFMMAMTMPYPVASTAMLDNLNAGDLITADLEVKDNAAVLTRITKTGSAPAELPPASPISEIAKNLIKEGQPVPNTTLIDQDGKSRPFNDIRNGHPMALTFMYTKCPMPTYCPMMDRNFVEVQKAIKSTPKLQDVHLLSVSFDPKNDTPAVLKEHAKGLGADPTVWTFATADADVIDKFAMSFGVTLVRDAAPDPNEIGHTLRTAVIDRDGKLVKIYTGNDWTPADLIASLEQLP